MAKNIAWAVPSAEHYPRWTRRSNFIRWLMVRKGSALILGSNGNKVIFLVTTLDHEVIGECWITSEQLENVIEQAQQVRAYGKLINE